jgi:hypothetical protein
MRCLHIKELLKYKNSGEDHIEEKNNTSYFLEYFFMLAVTFINCIISFVCYRLSYEIIIPAFFTIIVCIIVLWTKQLSKKALYLLDILNILGAIVVGGLIASIASGSTDLMTGIFCGIVIMDVFSFTKAGGKTPNTKLAGHTNTLARLSICLPIPKKRGVQPIIGIGDLLYYSLIMMYSLKSNGMPAGWAAFLLILAGQLTNILFISIIRHKHWYRGFPATLFPGMFFVAAAFLNKWL